VAARYSIVLMYRCTTYLLRGEFGARHSQLRAIEVKTEPVTEGLATVGSYGTRNIVYVIE
jgi:hypothetical protein